MFLVWLLSFNSYRLIDVSVWLVGSTSVTHLFWIIIQQKSCVRTFHQCSFSRAGQLNMYISSILSITLQTAFRNFQTGDSHLKIIEKLILKSKKNNNKVAFFFLGVFFFFLNGLFYYLWNKCPELPAKKRCSKVSWFQHYYARDEVNSQTK